MISVITPSHDDKYLEELYQSLLEQTYEDWEWVLVPNGKLKDGVFDFKDKRVKIYPFEYDIGRVGAMKLFAAKQAKGDIIAEVDHDDILMPECLEKVQKAFDDNPDVCFVYSNSINADIRTEPWSPVIWDTQYGWSYREVEWKGRSLIESRSADPYPQSISRIWFAPNHIRAWRAKDYWELGGHDQSMQISDDHDLMLRTYLHGKMLHIDEPLYIYRVHGENTWLEHQQKIQFTMWENHDKYFESMMIKWSKGNGLRIIDLCGGHNCPEGFESIDLQNADIICDLDGDWGLEDNSVGYLRAADAIEHLKSPEHTMMEAYRVLAHGGVFNIAVPSTDGRGAWQDPTHCCYSEDTEILTTEGFKLFSELTGKEEVYSYNDELKIAEEQPIQAIQSYDYEGDMVHFYGRAIDCLVTPNHKMFAGCSDTVTPFRFVEAQELLKRKAAVRIPSDVLFDGDNPEYFEIPNSQVRLLSNPKKGFVNDTIRLPIKSFMEFMGWYLSEGWTTINNTEENGGKYNFYRIGIGQSEKANPEKHLLIKECIEKMGFTPHKTQGGWCFSSKPFARWLAKLGKSPERYIPIKIKQMNPELLEIMLDALMLGDGSFQGSGGTYASTSFQLASDVQEVAIKCGYRSTMGKENRIGRQVLPNPDYRAKYDMHLVYLSKTKERYLTNKELVEYNGKIYCVTVPEHHVILTRRNGKVIWAGNSFWNDNSFMYYTMSDMNKFIDCPVRFQRIKVVTDYMNDYGKELNIPYVFAQLVAIKQDEPRFYGPLEI